MKFKVDVVRSVAMAGLAMVLLASCGGGTEIAAFVPRRVIAFGDESSLINSDGNKYTVNGVVYDSSTPPVATVTCSANQVWSQILAGSYGLLFPQCSGGAAASGEMRATVGATTADVQTQIDVFLGSGSGPFASNDLVTLWVGMNDVLALYNQINTSPGISASNLIGAAQAAGTAAGAQVVRITNLGAKVIVSTIPDMGSSPFGLNEELAHPGEGRASLLSQLSKAFNDNLRLKLEDVRDGGHAVGLILTDELVLSMTQVPASYGLTRTDAGVCDDAHSGDALPTCTMLTLRPDADATLLGNDWLWADDRRLSATAQLRIGTLAINRAHSNPF